MLEAIAETIWEPQPGSQQRFLSCPYFEVLYEGTRGPGKTDALLMDFAQHVGLGFGRAWRGILFRRTYPELEDAMTKTKRWFFRIFPTARWIGNTHKWVWPGGEELLLRYMNNPDDYWNYHGHEYPWIGFEELTTWATSECYEAMMSCCRSSHPGMPRKYRSTANPWGLGHHWVKARFIDPGEPEHPIVDESGRIRTRIHGNIYENKILLRNDPDYLKNLLAITDENKRKAWLGGDWGIVAGGMLGDVWNRKTHVIRPFKIPDDWAIFRSFDWGSSKPFSVGWWAESNGEEVEIAEGVTRSWPRGTLFRIAEWYGWNGEPNKGCKMLAADVARGILEREESMKLAGRVEPGPADNSIWDVVDGHCIADSMSLLHVDWTRSNKGKGSRVNGWEILRERLQAGLKHPMEAPGLFVFETCRHFIRTIPVLPRDTKNPDDVDTNSEDHVADEVRYVCLSAGREILIG